MDLGESQDSADLISRLENMAVNNACTLIYTSGTTGQPKVQNMHAKELKSRLRYVKSFFVGRDALP